MSRTVIVVMGVLIMATPLYAQVRVTPKAAKGGTPEGEPWADVPEAFRNLKIPDWPVPTDLDQWQKTDRAKTRETLVKCLGNLPARPDPTKVKVTKTEDHDSYTVERFEFSNGVDAVVT